MTDSGNRFDSFGENFIKYELKPFTNVFASWNLVCYGQSFEIVILPPKFWIYEIRSLSLVIGEIPSGQLNITCDPFSIVIKKTETLAPEVDNSKVFPFSDVTCPIF